MAFRYLRDPLFVFCVLLYLVNRSVLKPVLGSAFCYSYLNDLICVPFWLPIMLFVMRRFRLREHDQPPKSYEIIISLVVWSLAFELLVPRLGAFRGLAYPDHLDIMFYAAGALVASVFWALWYRKERPTNRTRRTAEAFGVRRSHGL